jgi:hypothetical protein
LKETDQFFPGQILHWSAGIRRNVRKIDGKAATKQESGISVSQRQGVPPITGELYHGG